jgi:uncharacterized coiled-coil protein SlyX
LDINDRIAEWNRQLEQASEYGLFFDKNTVREMIQTIVEQQKEIEVLNKNFLWISNKLNKVIDA